MTRPIQARIHMDALAHNYSVAKQLAPRSQALAVIKADGYGHGYARVVRALPHADGFAMLNLENAIALRESGEIRPLMMLEGFFDREELLACAEHDIWTSVHSEHQLALLESTPLPRPVSVWLKLNTGMNRLGFRPEAALAMAQRLRALPQVRLTTLMTHFATADDERGIAGQMARFQPVAAALACRSAWPIRQRFCATTQPAPNSFAPASCCTVARRLPAKPANSWACARP